MNYVHGVIGGLSRVMNPMVAAPVAQSCTKLAIRVDVAASVDNISWALLVLRTSAVFKINAERHSISGHRIARAGGCVGTGSVPTGPASSWAPEFSVGVGWGADCVEGHLSCLAM